MRNRRLARALLAAAVLAACGCTKDPAASSGLPRGVVARVGDKEISQAQLDLRSRVFELFFQQPMAAAQTRSQLLEQLVEEQLIVAEAQKQNVKLDEAVLARETGLFMAALEERYQGRAAVEKNMQELKLSADDVQAFLSNFLLAQQMVDGFKSGITLSEEEIKQFYEQNKASLYTFTEDVVRARHILLPASQEDKAKELAERARRGEDFAQLAREHSTDPGSGRAGGDLGYFRRADLVPEFADVAFGLEAGAVGGPVKSQFGWHIIKVEDRRPPGIIPFEQAKSDIVNKLLPAKQNEALARWLDGLKQAAGVQKADIAAEPAPK